MKLAREDVTLLEGLDHPECVCLDENGVLYAGGEAGQLYRIASDGSPQIVASTGGFLLGIAIDGRGRLYACDSAKKNVCRIAVDGEIREWSSGATERPFALPNFPVFDAVGNLYVSDSGDYWNKRGTGCIMRISPQGETSVFHHGPFAFANGLALDPAGEWLYVVQSTASNVVRVPLGEVDGRIEVTHELPPGCVPDGLAFANDGWLVIACYKPDALFLGDPHGHIKLFYEDETGELLSRPTNVAIGDGCLYVANLGGWHIARIESKLFPRRLFRPTFD